MTGPAAIWHDVECGSYDADLPLWEELAERHGSPILELGCGTGRVALHLARRGHELIGLDVDPELLVVLNARAQGLQLKTHLADAREFELREPAALVLAPTHLLQLLPGPGERGECLRSVASALQPGGLLAVVIIEEMPEPDGAPAPLPDVREIDGWVYSSLAIEAATGPGEIVVRRLRQTVSPDGALSEEPNEVRIATFTAGSLETEAEEVGLRPVGQLEIAPTDLHVGSKVVLLERAS
jgi:SAM-dependent methyltransferase